MSDLRKALDFIEAADRTTTLAELQDRLAATLSDFGVSQFALIALGRRPDNGAMMPYSLSRPLEPGWSARYNEMGYANADLVVHAAMRQSGAFTWDDLHPRMFTPSAKTVFNEGCETMGVKGGLVIPTHDTHGFAGFISPFFPDASPDQSMHRALKLIAIYALDKAKELRGIAPEMVEGGPCPLTPRQREALSFMAAGKTDWEIGAILGIAEKTANHHVEAAKRQLGVATRAQAVALAVHRGWIGV